MPMFKKYSIYVKVGSGKLCLIDPLFCAVNFCMYKTDLKNRDVNNFEIIFYRLYDKGPS